MSTRNVGFSMVGAVAIGALAIVVGANAGRTNAGAEGAATTITIWGHQGQAGEVAVLQGAVKAFNASQSKIKADLRLIPEADYTKTITATRAGDLPDVLEYDGPLMSSFAYAKKLGPVSGVVSKATIANQTASVRTQNTYVVDHKLYGLSIFDSGLGMYGNKKLLRAAGVKYPTGLKDAWTAKQFTSALKKLAKKDKDGAVLDIKENYAGEWPTYGFLPVVYSTGNVVVDRTKADGHLNSPAVVKAVETFATWRKYVDPNSDDKAFVSGRVALSWVGHWVFNDYRKAVGANLVVLPLPDFGAGPKSGQGSWAWGIGASSKNGKAAGKFLDFLMSDKNVKAMTDANGAPPGTKSAYPLDPLYKEGGKLYLFAQELAATCGSKKPTRGCVATPRPVTPAYPTISKQFADAFWGTYKGGDAKSLLDKAARAIDIDYEDNGNYGLR